MFSVRGVQTFHFAKNIQTSFMRNNNHANVVLCELLLRIFKDNAFSTPVCSFELIKELLRDLKYTSCCTSISKAKIKCYILW